MRCFLALALITAAACGPKTLANDPPPAPPSDEPWVKEHVAIVKAACECEDSACLETAKAEIDALEAAHGGLDESPADVHQSRGRFETCYRSGTNDPVRDLSQVTESLCRCAESVCVDKALIARLNVDDKYANATLGDEQKSEIGALNAKYASCKRAKIITGEAVAAHVEKVMFAVCDCAGGSGCGLPLTSLDDYPSAPKVTDFDDVKDRVKLAMERLCNCATNGGVSGTYGGINTRRRCPKPEK